MERKRAGERRRGLRVSGQATPDEQATSGEYAELLRMEQRF